MRVLIVDDSDIFRTTVARALAALLDADVTQLDRGEAVADELDRERFDLVLVDMRMPHMDGIEVCRQILARPDRPRVVLMTAYGEREYVRAARRIGVDGFVCKTDGMSAMLDAVSGALDHRDVVRAAVPAVPSEHGWRPDADRA